MAARTLMVMGTHSGAGKSVVVAALCRLFAERGLRVAPFKAQNMSLNAAVTAEGHEIGRSTWVQAAAAGVLPEVDMNPILLKPEAERRSQLILGGRAAGYLDACNWQERRRRFWPAVTAAFDRLRERFDLVILEGAGSPAEINLRPGDIVNMPMAEYADAPVLLVGDIDRGGVFAALVGTVMLLEPEERQRIGGFLLNRFRGDPVLLGDGPERLRERSGGIPTLGVIPYLSDLGLAEEDGVPLERRTARQPPPEQSGALDLAVLAPPHMANFDDFDPLAREPGVAVRFVRSRHELAEPAAILLPGSKLTLADLEWLRQRGLAEGVVERAAAGTAVVGICAGYQMLGERLEDPHGVEAAPGRRASGLGLLPIVTTFDRGKRTRLLHGRVVAGAGPFAGIGGAPLRAYEIHAGRSRPRASCHRWLFELERDGLRQLEGSLAAGGLVWGTYLHGLFDNDALRHAWLRSLGWEGEPHAFDRERAHARWAAHVERHVDLAAIERLVGGAGCGPGLRPAAGSG